MPQHLAKPSNTAVKHLPLVAAEEASVAKFMTMVRFVVCIIVPCANKGWYDLGVPEALRVSEGLSC